MFNTLSYIGEQLNNSNITWAIGASILLNQFGLIDKPNDIDIFVAIDDIDKIDFVLRNIGIKKDMEKTSVYSTRYFYEYIINGFDIDVMGGFAINHNNGIFEYIFDNNSISEFRNINGVTIPFTSLEDWYVLYQLIPNREMKVSIIEDYLRSNGIKNPFLLQRALKGNLPEKIRENVEQLLVLHNKNNISKYT